MLALLLTFAGCNDKPEINPIGSYSGSFPTSISVYPNPATNAATIGVSSRDTFTLFVFDTYGKIILERRDGKGSYQFDVPLVDKPKGTYHVMLKSKTGTFKQNLLKL